MKQELMELIQRAFFAAPLLFSLCTGVAAQEAPRAILRHTTVLEFAQECQHSGMKSQPDMRLSICASYIAGAAYQIGLSKSTESCWKERRDGGFGVGPVGEVIFHLATLPQQQDRPVGETIRWVLLDVATKSCK